MVPVTFDCFDQRRVGLLARFGSTSDVVEAFACARVFNMDIVSRFEDDLLRPTAVLSCRAADGSSYNAILFRAASARFPLVRAEKPLEVGQTHRLPGCALTFLVVGEDPSFIFRHSCATGRNMTLDDVQAMAVDYAGRLIDEKIDGRGSSFLHTVASRFRCICNPGFAAPDSPPPGPATEWPLPGQEAAPPAERKRHERSAGFKKPHFESAEELFCFFAQYWVDNETGDLTQYTPGITHRTHWPLPLVYDYPRHGVAV